MSRRQPGTRYSPGALPAALVSLSIIPAGAFNLFGIMSASLSLDIGSAVIYGLALMGVTALSTAATLVWLKVLSLTISSRLRALVLVLAGGKLAFEIYAVVNFVASSQGPAAVWMAVYVVHSLLLISAGLVLPRYRSTR